MSNHLFTADLHLGHKLVAGLRGFDNTADHDRMIIGKLVSDVRENDVLWILGDYSVSQHGQARALLSQIRCRKILIPGNHDPEHPMHRGAWKAQRTALDTFEAVLPYQRIRLSKQSFIMSHLPYLLGGDHASNERYPEYRLPNTGLPLLCGHVHDAWRFKSNQFNVGVDVNGFRPVKANTVIDWWEEESHGRVSDRCGGGLFNSGQSANGYVRSRSGLA